MPPAIIKDREKALKDLFSSTEIVAAGRGPWGEEALDQLLGKAENRPYGKYVHYFSFPQEMRDLASSEMRTRIAARASVRGQLPDAVEKFVTMTGAYQPAYGVRRRLLEVLYGVRGWAEKECDFKVLLRIAAEKTDRGGKLRKILGSDKMALAKLKGLVLEVGKS